MVTMSRRHHEYRIAYLRDRLSKTAHGFFSSYKGRNTVYVSYDPNNPKVDRNHKLHYSLTSRKGKLYSAQVNEYLALKSELDELLKAWKAIYINPPRDIHFPLKKKRRDKFDYEWFRMAEEYQNQYELEDPIEYKNFKLRSKNELSCCQLIKYMQYEQKIEVRLQFDEFTYLFPDDTIYIPEINKVLFICIDGAMDKQQYMSKSYRDTAACITNGLMELKDFIVIRLPDARHIWPDQIELLIRAAIESSIDDIVGEP